MKILNLYKVIQLNLFDDIPLSKKSNKKIRDKFNDYNSFVDKFVAKKTTDDCYTPPKVYDCVRDFVNGHVMPLDGLEVVRPFFPGGDYENYPYPENCIVIDNPPFSIISKITRFYEAYGIRFFIFAPALTLFTSLANTNTVTGVVVGSDIIYENGAKVSTSFLTNVWPGHPMFVISGQLHEYLSNIQNIHKIQRAKYRFPPNVVSGAILQKYAKIGVNLECPRNESHFIRNLDCGTDVFGQGFLISDKMADAIDYITEGQKVKWMFKKKAKMMENMTEELPLSDRERRIIGRLGNVRH